MSERLIQVSTLTEIADAIREKKGTNAPILLAAFAEEISTIETGSGGGGGMLTASTEEEMLALITEENIGQFIYYNGVTGTYVNGEYYKVVEDNTPDARYCQLYDLPNGATASDIAVGKQAYDAYGGVVSGTGIMTGQENKMSYIFGVQDSVNLPYDLMPNDFGGVTAIMSSAFISRSGIRNLSLNDECKIIHQSAFYTCFGLVSVNTGGVETIEQRAFYSCSSIQTLTASNVKTIGSSAFYGCQMLHDIHLDNIETIGQAAFHGASLIEEVSFSKLVEVGYGAFSGCNRINNIDLPMAKVIGATAFNQCSAVSNISIPCVETIGSSAFAHHRASYIVIPSTCVKIDYYAFYTPVNGCIYRVEASVPPILEANVLYGVSRIDIKSEYLETYKTASVWSGYSSKMVGY